MYNKERNDAIFGKELDDYRHFVVWYPHGNIGGLKIESGWEYRDDAREQLDEINDTLFYAEKNNDGALDIKVRVMSRIGLLRIRAWHGDNTGGMDIDNSDNWSNIPW